MAGNPPYSVQKYYPFTDEEMIEIAHYKSQQNGTYSISKYIGYGCSCGEVTLVLGHYDGDGDYSFIRPYYCNKCGGEIRMAHKCVGDEVFIKVNNRYGKKIKLLAER